MALFEGPREYQAAIDTLSQVAAAPDFVDRANALYYIGLAYRSLGRIEQAQAALKPKEAPQHLQTARQRFEQAAPHFAAAATAFAARLPAQIAPDAKPAAEAKPGQTGAEAKPAVATKAPSLDAEWYVRAKCDEAEMLLELGKQAEARAIVDTLASNPLLAYAVPRYAALLPGLCGLRSERLLAAGRALGELAPFDNPAIGLHARYLLARTHHLANRRPEAAAQVSGGPDGLRRAEEMAAAAAERVATQGQSGRTATARAAAQRPAARLRCPGVVLLGRAA